MKAAFRDKATFEQVSVFMKTDEERIGPSGSFFSVPKEVDLQNVKTNPTRAELLSEALKSFEYPLHLLFA